MAQSNQPPGHLTEQTATEPAPSSAQPSGQTHLAERPATESVSPGAHPTEPGTHLAETSATEPGTHLTEHTATEPGTHLIEHAPTRPAHLEQTSTEPAPAPAEVPAPPPVAVPQLAPAATTRTPAATQTLPHHRPVAAEPATILLRAGAAVLIVYGYLVGLWAARDDTFLGFVDVLRRWVNRPFGLGEDFGPFGVMLLLAACGYGARPLVSLFTHGQESSAGSTRQAGLAGSRGWRVFVPVWVATVLGAVLVAVGARVWTAPADASLDPLMLLGNVLLLNHLVPGVPVLVPLGWVALLAALGVLSSAGMARLRAPARWVVPVGQLVVVAGLVVAGAAVEPLRAIAVHASFYPVLVAGQLVALARTRALPGWLAGVLGMACWVVVAVAEPLLPPLTGWWYPVAAAYAGLLLAITVLLQGRVAAAFAANPVVGWVSARVWWLAVLSGVVGFPVLDALAGPVPPGAAVAIAVAATALAAELAHALAVHTLLVYSRAREVRRARDEASARRARVRGRAGS